MRVMFIASAAFALAVWLPGSAGAGDFLPVGGTHADEFRLEADCGPVRVIAQQGGIAFALGMTIPRAPRRGMMAEAVDHRDDQEAGPRTLSIEGQIVLVEFVGADPSVRPEGRCPHPMLHNSYDGKDRSRWRECQTGCGEVLYRGIWPGVDLLLRPDGARLAYEWRGSAEALKRIAVRWRGSTAEEEVDGSETISTPHGSLIVSPSLGAGGAGWISLASSGRTAPATAPAMTLSPVAKDLDRIVWSTFIGGSSVEESFAVASNGAGRTFFTGYTESLDYPTIPGTVIVPGGRNVLVTALDEESGYPVWSTVLNGNSLDEGRGVSVLSNGNIAVAGRTFSTDFPTTPGVMDSTSSGTETSFVAELDVQTGRLVWCTLLDNCGAKAVAATSGEGIVIGGWTTSVRLPLTPGAFQTVYGGGNSDGFVARVSHQGRQLDWCTYLGGSDHDEVSAIAVDGGDRPVIGGYTGGTYFWSDFPVTAGSYDSFYDGYTSGFVTKLSTDGSQVVWSTFVGGGQSTMMGSGSVYLTALQLAADGRIVVGGYTTSENLPVTTDAYQTSLRGWNDGVVCTLSADGSTLLQSTYLGCPTTTVIEGLTLPPGGGILVSGRASGPTFPGPLGPDQFAVAGVNAAFLAHLNSAGQTLLGGGVYGGIDWQQGDCHALTRTGAAILVGATWSANFPVTAGCYDDSIGGEDIFAMKVQSLVTPVSLRLFEALREATGARLRWLWEGIPAADGMRLWREEPGLRRRLVTEWADGSVNGGEFTDGGAPVGEASYWLQLLPHAGEDSWYGPAHLAAAALPERLAITSSAPNPFNPQTRIRYSLPQATRVALAIFDQRGRLVRALVDAALPAGEQSVEWDGRDAHGALSASGTYVIRLVTEQGVRTSKITLAK